MEVLLWRDGLGYQIKWETDQVIVFTTDEEQFETIKQDINSRGGMGLKFQWARSVADVVQRMGAARNWILFDNEKMPFIQFLAQHDKSARLLSFCFLETMPEHFLYTGKPMMGSSLNGQRVLVVASCYDDAEVGRDAISIIESHCGVIVDDLLTATDVLPVFQPTHENPTTNNAAYTDFLLHLKVSPVLNRKLRSFSWLQTVKLGVHNSAPEDAHQPKLFEGLTFQLDRDIELRRLSYVITRITAHGGVINASEELDAGAIQLLSPTYSSRSTFSRLQASNCIMASDNWICNCVQARKLTHPDYMISKIGLEELELLKGLLKQLFESHGVLLVKIPPSGDGLMAGKLHDASFNSLMILMDGLKDFLARLGIKVVVYSDDRGNLSCVSVIDADFVELAHGGIYSDDGGLLVVVWPEILDALSSLPHVPPAITPVQIAFDCCDRFCCCQCFQLDGLRVLELSESNGQCDALIRIRAVDGDSVEVKFIGHEPCRFLKSDLDRATIQEMMGLFTSDLIYSRPRPLFVCTDCMPTLETSPEFSVAEIQDQGLCEVMGCQRQADKLVVVV